MPKMRVNQRIARARPPLVAFNQPICVDLDGALVSGNVFWESLIALFKDRTATALRVLLSLVKGRAHLKRRLAENTPLDPARLSYRPDLLESLEDLHDRGACLVLATSSHESHARAVADHLGIFSEVVASDGQTNVPRRKGASLEGRYGASGFVYVGKRWSELLGSQAAAVATAVPATPAGPVNTKPAARAQFNVRRLLDAPFVRVLRPHQAAKNLLVFVPLIAAHQFARADLVVAAALTFIAFSLCASAIYILNDICDIEADRLHPRKRSRPFAAGELSIPVGLAASGVLLISSFTVALTGVSGQLALALLLYVVVTSAYSVRLKREPVVDVFTLAGLYVLRIVAGGIATATPLTSWLLGFALFLFLSLAFVKRYVELVAVNGRMPGRGYGPSDLLWMHAVGTASGYMAVLVLALYVNAPETTVLYQRPQVLWVLCPVFLFWLTRLWFRAGRQEVRDDPVLEAIKDPVSYIMGAVVYIVMFAAV
jgi:4-hydroxybenzoate polyprenyltransferase/phosphoglycolate phosphatase-like HAD superfamily hydrolase